MNVHRVCLLLRRNIKYNILHETKKGICLVVLSEHDYKKEILRGNIFEDGNYNRLVMLSWLLTSGQDIDTLEYKAVDSLVRITSPDYDKKCCIHSIIETIDILEQVLF